MAVFVRFRGVALVVNKGHYFCRVRSQESVKPEVTDLSQSSYHHPTTGVCTITFWNFPSIPVNKTWHLERKIATS